MLFTTIDVVRFRRVDDDADDADEDEAHDEEADDNEATSDGGQASDDEQASDSDHVDDNEQANDEGLTEPHDQFAAEEAARWAKRKKRTSPVIVWVGVFPGSGLSATAAHDVSQVLLALLKDHDISDVGIQYRESNYIRSSTLR